jgi:hypothetical protein
MPAAVGSGKHKITATYAGDAAHGVSDGSINETVTLAQCPPGQAGTPPNCLAPPTITRPSETHRVWREGNRLASFSRKHRAPVGTTFTFSLNEQAQVSFTFTQRVAGRQVRGKCVAQTRPNRRKRACHRTITAGALAFTAHPDGNKVAFQGRLSASQKLKPGNYTLTITAINAARQRSNPEKLSFTIVT